MIFRKGAISNWQTDQRARLGPDNIQIAQKYMHMHLSWKFHSFDGCCTPDMILISQNQFYAQTQPKIAALIHLIQVKMVKEIWENSLFQRIQNVLWVSTIMKVIPKVNMMMLTKMTKRKPRKWHMLPMERHGYQWKRSSREITYLMVCKFVVFIFRWYDPIIFTTSLYKKLSIETNDLKGKTLKEKNTAMLQVDFAENVSTLWQDKIQSDHWAKNKLPL